MAKRGAFEFGRRQLAVDDRLEIVRIVAGG